jgi:hypothetical protein
MCASVSVDIQQASVMVWHEILLYKLKSYREERPLQVRIDENVSDYHLIKAGLPQGSAIGP